MKLYRIGDRSLAQLLSGYQFLRQLDGYDVSSIADQMGAPVWEGKLDIVNDLNKEVTTSFPIDEALPDRKPGVYVLTAQPENDKSDDWQSRATQWFVVSDIGLTTYTGEDGLNVFARSLATAKPLVGVDLTLLARNNEVLGTAKTDETGRATFTPGLTRGEGGMVPAVLMASEAQSDFVFLDMSRAGFDLSDRGVAGRPAPGALDLYAWTERGIYRVGEHVHVGALARDAAAKAVENLPLTFIFTRPDGVEDRRIVSDGKSAGGHAVDLDLAENAMRGTWQVGIYTDPKKEPVDHADVPGRGLRAGSDRVRSVRRQERDRPRRARQRDRRRPLPLWRAGRRPCPRRRGQPLHDPRMGALQRLSISAWPTSRKATRPASR